MSHGKRPDCLFCIVVIHRNMSVRQKCTEILFLIYTVSENLTDRAVMCYL